MDQYRCAVLRIDDVVEQPAYAAVLIQRPESCLLVPFSGKLKNGRERGSITMKNMIEHHLSRIQNDSLFSNIVGKILASV